MKKFAFALMTAALFLVPCTAKAENQDVAKITCAEFMESSEEEMAFLLTWIDGYLSAKTNNTEINDEWFEKLGTHFGEFCTKNSKMTIMDAMKALPAN